MAVESEATQADRSEDEVREWREAISSIIAFEGIDRADEVLTSVVETARRYGARLPFSANTAYINTIAPHEEPPLAGNRTIEAAIKSAIRWNALAMVLRANKTSTELGGHIASYQSASTLYETGFQHFWHAPSEDARRRSDLLSGSFRAGHLRARLPGRAPHGRATAQLPAGDRRQGPLVLSAPLADAGILAVPDRFDGSWAADGDLSGPLPQVSARSRTGRHVQPQGLGVLRRRRDGRA